MAVVFPVPLIPMNMTTTGLDCLEYQSSKSNSLSLRTLCTASLMESSTTSSRVCPLLYFFPSRFCFTPSLISSTTGRATSASIRASSRSQSRSSRLSSLIFLSKMPPSSVTILETSVAAGLFPLSDFLAAFFASFSAFSCSFLDSWGAGSAGGCATGSCTGCAGCT